MCIFAKVAAGRIVHCLNADAHVTVVCPASGLNAEVAYRVARGQVKHVDRHFEPADLGDATIDGDGGQPSLVLVAVDDAAVQRSKRGDADAYHGDGQLDGRPDY